MDCIDGKILNEVQNGIPIKKRPFKKIADNLGISEDEVVNRINSLKEKGYIRRFGGIFDSQNLGVVSTLIAMKIEKDIDYVANIVSEYSGVTHNYQREDEYNLWFTLMASSNGELENILKEIKDRTGVQDILSLPSVNKHKVHVHLNFDNKG
ncbi:siroheme decarboxylase subunit alpha [Tepidibacter formicigenes]|jgi:DNA-binding Lrp family transcriptional regulator|uniref:siroheme decarboxylase n=1 Tax=Tepidibacter formicigenes DSM 15518 TaxID=1123349 RepID=A0A1M6S7A8_9FIRM|nr:AsnC family transcriptional regulator [Tepidibacter formicigenes]SHK40585.1 DNA-binding transcriptional regulator, Lrp family [Tepidibacter formicigenes DSM 15518]